MEALNDLLAKNSPIIMLLIAILYLLKDFARDFLARDAAAKLADKDPSNDKLARLEQSAAIVLDKIPSIKKP